MSPSIVTLTLNPALDVSSAVPVVAPTHKLRCANPNEEPGGGGINVARVCSRLGEDTLAIVPLGGPVGQRVHDLLVEEGVPAVVVPINGQTRQSVTINQSSNGDQFRFVFPGPTLTSAEIDACRDAAIHAARNAKCLVVSGSMPIGVDGRIVAELAAALPGVRILVDTSGQALAESLGSTAYLAKPSANELATIVGRSLETEADILEAAVDLVQSSQLHAIAVSIGPGGVIVAMRDGGVLRFRAPTVKVRSAVGAGDSMVAGIAVGLARGLSLSESMSLGTAAGTAAVISDGSRLCDPADVARLLPLVAVDARD
ncbi:MAG: 1-phosphofructokinase family hexose kinase [Acidimicrobiales bacterium]